MSYTFRKQNATVSNSDFFYIDFKFDIEPYCGYFNTCHIGPFVDFDIYLYFNNDKTNYLYIHSGVTDYHYNEVWYNPPKYVRDFWHRNGTYTSDALYTTDTYHFRLSFTKTAASANYIDFKVENDSSKMVIDCNQNSYTSSEDTYKITYEAYDDEDNIIATHEFTDNYPALVSLSIDSLAVGTIRNTSIHPVNKVNISSSLFNSLDDFSLTSSVTKTQWWAEDEDDVVLNANSTVSKSILDNVGNICCVTDFSSNIVCATPQPITALTSTFYFGKDFTYKYIVTDGYNAAADLQYQDSVGNTWSGKNSGLLQSKRTKKVTIVCPELSTTKAIPFSMTATPSFTNKIGDYNSTTKLATQSEVGGEWVYNDITIPTTFKVTCTNATEHDVRKNLKITPFAISEDNLLDINITPHTFSNATYNNCVNTNGVIDLTSATDSDDTPYINFDCTTESSSETVFNSFSDYTTIKKVTSGNVEFIPEYENSWVVTVGDVTYTPTDSFTIIDNVTASYMLNTVKYADNITANFYALPNITKIRIKKESGTSINIQYYDTDNNWVPITYYYSSYSGLSDKNGVLTYTNNLSASFMLSDDAQLRFKSLDSKNLLVEYKNIWAHEDMSLTSPNGLAKVTTGQAVIQGTVPSTLYLYNSDTETFVLLTSSWQYATYSADTFEIYSQESAVSTDAYAKYTWSENAPTAQYRVKLEGKTIRFDYKSDDLEWLPMRYYELEDDLTSDSTGKITYTGDLEGKWIIKEKGTDYRNTLCRYIMHRIKRDDKLYFCPIKLFKGIQSVTIYPIGVHRNSLGIRFVLYDLTNIKNKGVDFSTDYDDTGFNTDKFSLGIHQLENIKIELDKGFSYTTSNVFALLSTASNAITFSNPSFKPNENTKDFELLLDGRRVRRYTLSGSEFNKLNSSDTATIDSRFSTNLPDNYNEIDLGFCSPTKDATSGTYAYTDMFKSDLIAPSWIRYGHVLPMFNEVYCLDITKYSNYVVFLVTHEDSTHLNCSGVLDDDIETARNIVIRDNYIHSFYADLLKSIHATAKWDRSEGKIFYREEGKLDTYAVRDSYINNGALLVNSNNNILCTIDENNKLCLII